MAKSKPDRHPQPPSGSRLVEAEQFVLKDANGQTRAVLDMAQDGPRLTFFRADGKPALVVGVHQEGPGIALLDGNGRVRAGLGVGPDGPRLLLFDENGKPIPLTTGKRRLGDGLTFPAEAPAPVSPATESAVPSSQSPGTPPAPKRRPSRPAKIK